MHPLLLHWQGLIVDYMIGLAAVAVYFIITWKAWMNVPEAKLVHDQRCITALVQDDLPSVR